MKGTFLAIALHLTLAGILSAHVLCERLIAKSDFPNQNAQVQIWEKSANLLISGKSYDLTGTAVTDPYGGVTLLESPTGNAVTIFSDGSADVYVGGVLYRFEAE